MNTYSRRYNCNACGGKGRCSRDKIQNGIIRCAYCGEKMGAMPLFGKDEKSKTRFFKAIEREILPV